MEKSPCSPMAYGSVGRGSVLGWDLKGLLAGLEIVIATTERWGLKA